MQNYLALSGNQPFEPLAINPDKLASAASARVARATVRAIDPLQGLREEERILGLAAAFYLICQTYSLNENDMIRMAKRIAKHHDATYKPEFRAVLEYMKDRGR